MSFEMLIYLKFKIKVKNMQYNKQKSFVENKDCAIGSFYVDQRGRSMVEMLGVLVIVGVLSITAIVGFNWAISKTKANTLYNDIKLAYVQAHTQTTLPDVWSDIGFTPDSGYVLSVRRDINSNDFVLAKGIEKRVCDKLLDMAEEGEEVTLFYADNTLLTCEADSQDIVASFSGEPPVITCETGEDCPERSDMYCAGDTGICTVCPLGEKANSERTGCENLCSDTDEVTCILQEQNAHWCCPYDTFCSEITAGLCVASDGVCIYNFHGKSTEGLLYKTDCSYLVSSEEVVEKYSTDCAYNVSATEGVEKYTTDCSYVISGTEENTTVTVQDKCTNPSHYCALNWSDDEWSVTDTEPVAASEATGKIYGKCQMLSTFDTTPITKYAEGSGLVSVKTPCKNGFYCALNWSDATWEVGTAEPVASSEAKGTVYGKCQMLSTFDTTPIITYIGDGGLVSKKEGCDGGEYCALNWSAQHWASGDEEPIASSERSGVIYGKCQMLSTFDTTPIVEKVDGGNASYTVQKECPVKQYCHLQWKNTECEDASSDITGPVYGACARMDSTNTTCPTVVEGNNG